MNSAEKFADIVIKELWIEFWRVTKFKISSYENGISTKRLLSKEDKESLITSMWLEMQDRVLVIEDLMDTWHTLRMIEDFFSSHLINTKVLCLFDKHVDDSKKTRMQLGERFSSIIDIWKEFVIGFGMDYEHRLWANIEWLWKIKEKSNPELSEILDIFVEKIKYILQRPDQS